MWRVLPVLLVLCMSACSLDSTAPVNTLIGRWGGPGLELTADHNLVRAQFQCDAAVFHAPLNPSGTGEFALPGTVSTTNGSVQVGARGLVSGATITLEVIRWFPGGKNVQQFVVMRDKPADLSGICAL